MNLTRYTHDALWALLKRISSKKPDGPITDMRYRFGRIEDRVNLELNRRSGVSLGIFEDNGMERRI